MQRRKALSSITPCIKKYANFDEQTVPVVLTKADDAQTTSEMRSPTQIYFRILISCYRLSATR